MAEETPSTATSTTANGQLNPQWMVERKISTPAIAHRPDLVEQLTFLLEQLPGMNYVDADENTSQISLSYDASQLHFSKIEHNLNEIGIYLSESRWQQLKRGFYCYIDKNIQQLSRQPQPACCNRLPPQYH